MPLTNRENKIKYYVGVYTVNIYVQAIVKLPQNLDHQLQETALASRKATCRKLFNSSGRSCTVLKHMTKKHL